MDNSATSFPHDIAIDDVSITVPVTNSYLWSNGATTKSTTGLAAGSYTVTVTNSNGCTAVDSVVLAAPALLTSSISDTACNSYTWAQNGMTYTMSGTFSDTVLSTVTGCDSILNLNLTILNNTTASISPIVCNNYTSPSGVIYTMSGMFMDTISNAAGCDSIISINLTVNNSTTSSISPVACNSYTSPSGAMYTMSGMFMDTISNAAGCDSIISINLSIDTVNNGVTQNGFTLTANDPSASYQWLDCNNGNAPISGEINQSFTATANGSYAVEVTSGTCIDTSSCVTVIGVGVEEQKERISEFHLYPNPAANFVTIQLPSKFIGEEVSIYTLDGSIVKTALINAEQQKINTTTLANGLYLVRYQNKVKRLIIAH